MDWQPIESAPEEREILVTDGQRVETAQLSTDCGVREWLSSVGGRYVDKGETELRSPDFEPTHWTLLPRPPQT